MPAMTACRSDSAPRVAEIVGLLELDELHRQGARLEDEREVLRLVHRAKPLDLGAVPRDPVRKLLVVDLRPRADLVVEHDREVLRRAPELAALRKPARDVVELVATRVRELERDDGLALEEVLPGAGEPKILAGHLGNGLLRDRSAGR